MSLAHKMFFFHLLTPYGKTTPEIFRMANQDRLYRNANMAEVQSCIHCSFVVRMTHTIFCSFVTVVKSPALQMCIGSISINLSSGPMSGIYLEQVLHHFTLRSI